MYYSNYNQSPQDQPIEAPSFHVHDEPPRPKKTRMGAKIVAACLACALVGGLAGGGVMLATGGLSDGRTAADAGSATTIYEATHTPTAVDVSQVESGTYRYQPSPS